MTKIITAKVDGEEYEVAVGRQCVVCEKANMVIRQRTGQGGSNETQHLLCPRCGASAHRQVNVVSGMVLLDSDHQGLGK